jgi:DNA-binding transcriptional LysR family regulator
MNGNVELRHLRYFLAVAEELHFGRAAAKLHMAQPPLSQQIRVLENIIGHALLIRSSRSVKLTVAGEELAARARRTLNLVSEDVEVVRSLARGEMGSLTVGFVGSAMLTVLPDILGKYRRLYPKVQLRLRELHTSALTRELAGGLIDVGLLRDPDPNEDLQIETVFTEPFVTVLPKTHVLARRTRVSVKLLKDEPFVSFPRSAGNYAWENTAKLCEEQGFQPNVVQEAPQWLTILKLVGAGLGVTIAPDCVKQISSPDLVCRKLSPSRRRTRLALVHRSTDLNPLAKAFCDLARLEFSAAS